ncbi:MAG: 2-oxoacid:acceptor oxidoreductase family protein, partial [Acidobacteria bacterium]|nr:2-oxoacid:acceptor oxidoreductase family protein [Acidobacteriota bacterium]MDW7984485.1 2-oxoacid:acceptor oxidoreductase family protein [Acidobacteriota bacterium]
MSQRELTVGVGGEAGEGIGRTGDSIAKIAARYGLHIYAYNSYQSVIRGGHVWLRIRIATEKVYNHGDHLDVLIALNQDTFDRHLREVDSDGWVLFNTEVVRVPEDRRSDLRYCGVPCKVICKDLGYKPVMQNTVLLGAAAWVLQFDFSYIEKVMQDTFKHKGDAVVRENVQVALRGYEYARENFSPIRPPFPIGPKPLAVTTGNEMFALGAVAAGCKFYAAYPMTPASSILHWFARYGPELAVVVKQCEDELAVINFAIGAGFAGVRALCATSGGGFSLMTEAIGEAAMTETPVVVINVMRGGPSTGLPTKTEQADFWQLFGASQGDYPKMIVA